MADETMLSSANTCATVTRMSNSEVAEAIYSSWLILQKTHVTDPKYEPMLAHYKTLIAEQGKRVTSRELP